MMPGRDTKQRGRWAQQSAQALLLLSAMLGVVLAPAADALAQMVPPPPAITAQGRPDLVEQIGIDQKLGETVAKDLTFLDTEGKEVRIGDYFAKRPVVLAFVYYECPMLCTLILNGMLKAFNVINLDVGKDFDVVTVSMDHRETAAMAAKKKNTYVAQYGRKTAAEGWHFLTGSKENIRALGDSVGYRFAYDADRDEFAHASGIMVLTAEGQLSKYFYGTEYSARDLRLGVVDASEGRIGSAVDKLLLFCYRYDPKTGKYGVVIVNVLRLTGGLVLALLAGFMITSFLNDRRKRKPKAGTEVPSSNLA